jgi:hypothetical protein
MSQTDSNHAMSKTREIRNARQTSRRHDRRVEVAATRAIFDRLESRTLLSGNFGSVLTRGESGTDIGNATAFDAQGNVVVAGSFSGTVDFAPGEDTNVYYNAADGTGYVAKYTPGGEFIWARRVGGPVNDVAVDRFGNVLVAGSFSGQRDFDSTAGTLELTSAGFDDIFVAKFNSSGTLQWAKRAGGTLADGGIGLDVDHAGSAYISGFFSNTVDFNPAGAVANRTASALTDGFIWKLSSAGNYTYVRVLAGNGSERVNDLAVDGLGNVYSTGRFDKAADFNPGGGVLLTSADATLGGNYDGFVWGLNANGTVRFVRRMGGGLYDTGEALDIDVVGNVYVTGRFTYQANFNPGGAGGTLNAFGNSGGDAFVAKYDSVGRFQWTKRIGGGETDDWGHSIAVDGSRNVYVAGQYAGIGNLNPNGFALVGSKGGTDAFAVKLDTDGDFVYGKSVGGSGNDVGRGVAVDALRGNVFVAGEFRNTADFDPSPATQNRASNGNADLFVLRLTQPASPLLWAEKKPIDFVEDEARFVATDGLGNTYIAGLIGGAGDFDPTGGHVGFGPIGSAPDVFVAKFAPDGTYIWSRIATHREANAEAGAEELGGLAVDLFGNVVVVGSFRTSDDKTLDFPNTNQDLQSDGSQKDAFIWKLAPNGDHVFAKRFGDSGTETADGVALGNNGDIYVTGTFDSRVQWGPDHDDEILPYGFYDPGVFNSQDVWVARLNANGQVQWAKGSGGSGEDAPTDIAFDFNVDAVRVVGTFNSPEFDSDTKYLSGSVSLGGTVSSFAARYAESNGYDSQLYRFGGGTGETRITAIDMDTHGAYYLTGEFTGTTDLDPGFLETYRTAAGPAGKRDVFLVKMEGYGLHAWSSRIGGTGDDYANGLDVAGDNVYVVGDFTGSVDFDPSALKQKTLTSDGLYDGYIWRVNRSGAFRSAHQIGGSALDVAGRSGNVAHVVGYTSDIGDYDPGAGTSFQLGSYGYRDWFLLSYVVQDTPSTPSLGGLTGPIGGIGGLSRTGTLTTRIAADVLIDPGGKMRL